MAEELFIIKFEGDGGGSSVSGDKGNSAPGGQKKPEQPFDPMVEAQKRLAGELRSQQIRAAYNQLVPQVEAVFDPKAAARNRINSEERSKLVQDEYRKVKGPDYAGMMNTAGMWAHRAGMNNLAAGAGVGQGILSAAGSLGMSGGAALAVAAPIAILAGAAYAFKAGVDHFISRGEALAQYSGIISGARARADVRSTLADVREAQELGEGIGSLTDSQSKIMDEIRNILLPIKRFVVEILAGIMEELATLAQDVGPAIKVSLELAVGYLKIMWDFLNGNWAKAQEDYKRMLERVEKAGSGRRDPVDLLSGLNNMGYDGRNGPADPMQTAARQQANTPGYSGAFA